MFSVIATNGVPVQGNPLHLDSVLVATNWAAVRSYLDAVTDAAAAQVIAKYTGVLGAADVFTTSKTFAILESIRRDLGYGGWIHP